MSVTVPQQYQSAVKQAADALGIPVDVVAAQIDLESSWNPNAVSPAGAEGIAQFEPGTWKDYGHGSPFDPTAAFAAYTAYMSALLKQEGGDIRKALEAYNAGPRNLSAGSGYASTILTRAGVSDSKAKPPGGGAGGDGGIVGGIIQDVTGGILNWPDDIVKFFSTATDDLTSTASWFAAFGRISTWIRIGAGVLAIPFLILGVWVLIGAARSNPLES